MKINLVIRKATTPIYKNVNLIYAILIGILIFICNEILILVFDLSDGISDPDNFLKEIIVTFLVGCSMLIGAFFSLILFYLLIEKLKFRILTLLLSGIVIAVLIFVSSAAFELFMSLVTLIVPLGELSYYIRLFFDYLIGGFALMGLVYIVLSKAQTPNIILVIFVSSFAGTLFFIEESKKLLSLAIIGVVVVLCLLLSSTYFAFRHSLVKQQIRKVLKLRYFLLILIFLVFSFVMSFMLSKYLRSLDNRCEEIQESQLEEKRSKTEQAENEKSELDFGSRPAKPKPKIVGYYQADEPVYLKTDVFRVVLSKGSLAISTEYYDFYRYEEYEDSYFSTPFEKRIRIIYKYNKWEQLPSAEKIIGFETPFYYSPVFGLLRAPDYETGGIEFLEYNYKTFDHRQDLEYLIDDDPYSYYYSDFATYVYEDADRYDDMKSLAEEIVTGATTNYEKAKAVENYLKENYYYSFQPGVEDLDSPIDDFLFGTKKGYCTYFATSMAVLLNLVGVEARVVGGFYSEIYSPELDSYIILSTDLHAWVEVFIPGYEWMTFEPTSSRCAPNESCQEIESIKNLSGLSEDEVNSILESVETKVTFEDIFNEQNPDELEFSEKSVSAEDMKNEWKKAENAKKAEEEREERERKEDELRKRQEERKRKIDLVMKSILFGVIVFVILCLLVLVFLNIYRRIKYRDLYKYRRIQKRVRKIDKKIRRLYIKRYNLSKAVYKHTNKRFLKTIDKHVEYNEVLIDCYQLIDKILYAKGFTQEDLINLERCYEKLVKG